jgi:hypothetical protein
MSVRALVVTGGHHFDEDSFEAMLAELADVSIARVRWPDVERELSTPAGAYDAYVFYDFGQEMSGPARAGLVGALERGAGAVFLHHAIYNHLSWPMWTELVGACWRPETFEIDGQTYGPSRAVLDQELRIEPAHRGHQITAGLSEFALLDESYGGYFIAPHVQPLLQTDHPLSESLVAWAQDLGWTRTVYLQPGHGPSAFQSTSYREVLERSLAWVGARGSGS